MMMNQGSPHILVVDDHSEIRDLLKRFLEQHGMRVSCARDGKEMKRLLDEREFDLLVLDLMMPGEDGLTLCRELRVKSRLPIIMLTAMGEETDRIIGLEMGADDYLSKPFNPRELLARIKAVMRRTQAESLPVPETLTRDLRFDRWLLDVNRRELVDEEGVGMSLSTAEFDLLWLLAVNAGRVLPRNEILKALRGLDYDGMDRSIDSRVSRLRRKLGDEAIASAHIKTVRPHGYLFSPSAW
jgi:two-component system OmpR family response regulator